MPLMRSESCSFIWHPKVVTWYARCVWPRVVPGRGDAPAHHRGVAPHQIRPAGSATAGGPATGVETGSAVVGRRRRPDDVAVGVDELHLLRRVQRDRRAVDGARIE